MFDLMKELSTVDLQQIKGIASKLPENFADTKIPSDIPKEAIFKFKISSESVDRDGEVVKANGIDFKWYKKNPIVLLNHWYSVENIIGKCTNIWQEGTDTYAEGYFSQTNPKAKLVQDLYNEKMVNVVSIGFIVKERDPNDRNVMTKTELLEFSVCAIQSNRDAERTDDQKALFQKGVEAGLIDISEKDVDETPEKASMSKDMKELVAKFDTFKTEISDKLGSFENMIKGLVDDKANKEADALEKAKKLKKPMQSLVKGLSALLEEQNKL